MDGVSEHNTTRQSVWVMDSDYHQNTVSPALQRAGQHRITWKTRSDFRGLDYHSMYVSIFNKGTWNELGKTQACLSDCSHASPSTFTSGRNASHGNSAATHFGLSSGPHAIVVALGRQTHIQTGKNNFPPEMGEPTKVFLKWRPKMAMLSVPPFGCTHSSPVPAKGHCKK